MLKSLKYINTLISNADSDNHSNVSYNKYFRDLSTISNTVLEDAEVLKEKEIKILAELSKLPESSAKQNIIMIIKGLSISGGGSIAG
jgi:hypothetical protein